MESQNTEQLTQQNDNAFEAIAVTENNDTQENSSLDLQNSVEPSLDGLNYGSVAQRIAGFTNEQTQKALCWDCDLQDWVLCPPKL